MSSSYYVIIALGMSTEETHRLFIHLSFLTTSCSTFYFCRYSEVHWSKGEFF